MKKIIPIFFSADDSFAPYLAVAVRSLVCNASAKYEYHLNVLSEDISEENQVKIRRAIPEDKCVILRFISMSEKTLAIRDEQTNRLRCDYFTLTIFFRLFIPSLFPEYGRGIYLDSDVVVLGDISELYHTDLKGNLIGACLDRSIHDIAPFVQYITEAVGVDREHYFNSGILLMDLERLREKKLSEKFLHLLNTYHFETIAPDQDYLNSMCFGQVQYLPECWDVMPKENEADYPDPKLVHYNLFSKPWCYDGVQYEEVFWKYARNSDFEDEIRTHKAMYTEDQKYSDQASTKRMMQMALEICNRPDTFRSVFESGRETRL